MKTLFIQTNKGGVGKSTLSCQLARYAKSQGLNVLIIDFEDQGNTTQHFRRGQSAHELSYYGISTIINSYNDALESQLLAEIETYKIAQLATASATNTELETGYLAVIPADGRLNTTVISDQKLNHEEFEGYSKGDIFLGNLSAFIDAMQPHFDLCIIDGAPNNDIRVTYGMTVANALVSPIQLAQESIEGMSETLNGANGYTNAKRNYNPTLEFFGFLPNMVKGTSEQLATLESIFTIHGNAMFRDHENKPVFIPDTTAIKDAQGAGLAIAEFAKTNSTARRTLKAIKPIFDLILHRLSLDARIQALAQKAAANRPANAGDEE